MDLVLASTSSSRRAMLEAAGVPFDAVPPGVDEDELKLSLKAEKASPRAIADALAEAKALKISHRMPDALVLGADQMLALDDGTTMDKAADMAELRAQLLTLRGRTHRLISAAVIAEAGRPVWRFVDLAKLHVRDFSESWLDRYLADAGETLLWGVGGYRIEEAGVQLFSNVEGDQFTIRGLPLIQVLDYLRTRGVMAA
ncbi:MAG: Maf family protein [Pacificimonas sp.]